MKQDSVTLFTETIMKGDRTLTEDWAKDAASKINTDPTLINLKDAIYRAPDQEVTGFASAVLKQNEFFRKYGVPVTASSHLHGLVSPQK